MKDPVKDPTVNPNGSISDGNDTTIYSDGSLEDSTGNKLPIGSKPNEDGSVTLPNGTVVKVDDTNTTVTFPNGEDVTIEGTITPNPDGSVTDEEGNTY